MAAKSSGKESPADIRNGLKDLQVSDEVADQMISNRPKEVEETSVVNGINEDGDELSDVDDDGEDSSDEESSSEDEEPIKAPLELMGEFLLYVRQGKWEDAKKLCTMILIYEPKNPEALQFKDTIEEKMKVEQELAEMSSEEETSSSEEEESSEDEQEEENEEQTGKESEESRKDDSESDEEDRSKHLRNKLIFSHSSDQKQIWKP
ncbi:uncharacterized protein LOC143446814 [Clavelina lepadiformis]|uniref:uncharacterized protein LOC143446814 n=1 Tax=Clavelina lepadiformis TaxID=159417 RepID=UPI004042B463